MGGYYWYSDNPNCGRCGHLNGQGFCNMTACIYPVLPQTAVMTEHCLTNADRIRAMSDEEMASLLMYFADETDEIDEKDYDAFRDVEWRERMLHWLKQEANE